MTPLIRQRLPILCLVLGGLFLFMSLAFMALPFYTMLLFERVEAVHYGTSTSEDYGSNRVIYDVPLQLYHFTPRGSKEKSVGIHTRDPAKTITVYFKRNPSSEVEYNVSDDNWRSGSEVMVLLIIGIVLLLPAVLAVVVGIVLRILLKPKQLATAP